MGPVIAGGALSEGNIGSQMKSDAQPEKQREHPAVSR